MVIPLPESLITKMVNIQNQAHTRVIAPVAINQHRMARKLLDPKDVSISMNVLYDRVIHLFFSGNLSDL